MSPNDLLYKRGTVQKKVANTNTGLDWPALTFEAALQGEDFQEVRIVTLLSRYEELCKNLAILQVTCSPIESVWDRRIHQRMIEIMDEGTVKVNELVTVNSSYEGVVIINEPRIVDDTVTRALQMLEQSKIPGVTNFSKPQTFTYKEFLKLKGD